MAKYGINVSLDEYEKASKKKKGIDELYDELDSIAGEFENKGQAAELPDFDMPDSLDLDRLDTAKKDAEELKKQAERENAGKYDDALDKLETETEGKRGNLEDKAKQTEEDAAKRRQELDKLFEEHKTKAEQQALKRGLARSSIIMNQLQQYDSDKLSAGMGVDEEARKEILGIQENIDALADKLQAAKVGYDDKLQRDIEKRMLDLLDEQEDKYIAALKYNNEQVKREADYLKERESALMNRAKTAAALEKQREEYGSELGQGAFLQAKFNAVKDYFDGMDAKDALSVLKGDKKLQDALGSYARLMRKYLEEK